MKLVNLLGAGALIAGTLVVSAPADAQRYGYGYHHRGPAFRGGYGHRYRHYGYRPYGYGYRSHYRGYRHYAYRGHGYRHRY